MFFVAISFVMIMYITPQTMRKVYVVDVQKNGKPVFSLGKGHHEIPRMPLPELDISSRSEKPSVIPLPYEPYRKRRLHTLCFSLNHHTHTFPFVSSHRQSFQRGQRHGNIGVPYPCRSRIPYDPVAIRCSKLNSIDMWTSCR